MSNVLNFAQPIRLGSLASDPGSSTNGSMYYNTSSNTIRQYLNGAWTDISSGTTSLTGQVLNNGQIIIGNGSNLSVAVTPAGDVTISNSGATLISALAVDNSKISATAAIAFSKLAALASGNILVGSAGTVATSVAMSGEATIVASGAVTLSNAAVIAKLLTGYSASAGTVSASDSILSALEKIDANDQLKLPLAGGTMSGVINMNSHKITNLTDPTSPQDAASKFYIDNLVAGLSWKNYVEAASAGSNVDLTAGPQNGDTLDGITLATGQRVLLKDQTAPAENGIYIVSASGPASRSSDMSTWAEVLGAVMLVLDGTVNIGSKWVSQSTDLSGVIGTTAMPFTAFSVAGTVNGTGTSGYVAYWNGTSSLTAEQFLSAVRGGTGGDSSGSTGIAHVASGVWSYSQIVNSDVSATAAIAYSKLALSNSIVNADINASAAIAYSKLNLASSIVNADIASGAAIAYSKLAALTANRALQSDGSGFVSASSVTSTELGYVSGVTSAIQTQIDGKASKALDNLASVAINTALLPGTDNSINLGSIAKSWNAAYIHDLVDGAGSNSVDPYNRALIDTAVATQLSWSTSGVELNQLTASTVPYLDASKIITSSSVTPTELGYVHGVTSAIQTQLNGKASTALDNLASTAVNADIVPASDNAVNLGSAAKNFAQSNARNVKSNATLGLIAATDIEITSTKVSRSQDGSNFVEEQYFDSENIVATGNTTISDFTYAFASYEGVEIVYKVKQASTGLVRIGTFRVANDSAGALVSYSDTFVETGDVQLTMFAEISGSNILISFTNASGTHACTLRADVKRIRA